MEFEIIIAIDSNYGIGLSKPKDDRTISWNISEELKRFKDITTENCIIMGRKTADTFKQPLPNRINIVISSNSTYRINEGFIIYSSLDIALSSLKNNSQVRKVFVIGGSILFKEAIKNKYCKKIHLTMIYSDYEHDIILNSLCNQNLQDINDFKRVNQQSNMLLCKTKNEHVRVVYNTYVYQNKEEIEYLNVLQNLLTKGHCRQTRNAITYSGFGKSLEFDLQNGFPLLTCKKMFTRGIIEELLFFLRGDTNTKLLEDKKVTIWRGNTNKDFIQNVNLPLKEFDMGPMYGFQWRHFNALYNGYDQSYENQGIDQLKLIINLLINDPYSRRIIMTTFNPEQADQGVLYPCHGLTIQFYVESDNLISLQMYQRSADWFLGVPFNIASYAFFLHIIINLVNNIGNKNYKPGRVIMIFGDVHFYSAHLDQVNLILGRMNDLHRFPSFNLNKKLMNLDDIFNLEVSDFIITDYFCEDTIKADMIC